MQVSSYSLTVVIPTYNRPDLLEQAIASIWAQTVLPEQILIGDDSVNQNTEELVNEKLIPISPIPIKYFHHNPSLGQAKNVDFLFQKVQSDTLLLLHDDDLLMPRCLELLKEPLLLDSNVVASFGNQAFVDHYGETIPGSEEQLNKMYYRIPENVGYVNAQWASILQMFPNDAFLVRTEIAKNIGYFGEDRAGDAVDFYFGYRLGKLRRPFFWVDELTAKYRLSTTSITRNPSFDAFYKILKILFEDLNEAELSQPEIQKRIQYLLNPGISQAIKTGDKKTAIRWIFSTYYRTQLLTPKGLKRILMVLLPFHR